MGVLSCDRLGCENIMCDYLSSEHGYICNYCLNELKEKPWTDIEVFMNTFKECSPQDEDAWLRYLENVFQDNS